MSVLVEFPIEEAEAMMTAHELLVALGFPGGRHGRAGFNRLEQAIEIERGSGGTEERSTATHPNIIIFGGAVFEGGKAA